MTVINLISPADFINGITTWASPMFDEFQAVIWVSVGFVAGALIIVWFGDTIKAAIAAIMHKDESPF